MKSLLPHEGTERIRNDTTYKNFTTNCFLCSSVIPRSLLVSFILVESPSGKEENFVWAK